MIPRPLSELIFEASTQLGSDACRAGRHSWNSEGGRHCPQDLTDGCSQTVYRCSTCGEYDYGAPGGPGDLDCLEHCRHRTGAPA